MKPYSIEEADKKIKITFSQEGKPKEIFIFKSQLADIYQSSIKEIKTVAYSQWVISLSREKEVPKDLLYDLAVYIHTLYPENRIGWISTFIVIEKNDFVKATEKYHDINLPELSRIEKLKKKVSEILDEGMTKEDEENIKMGVLQRLIGLKVFD